MQGLVRRDALSGVQLRWPRACLVVLTAARAAVLRAAVGEPHHGQPREPQPGDGGANRRNARSATLWPYVLGSAT
jgi:hypothetical protein